MNNKSFAVMLAVVGVAVFGLAVSLPVPHPVVGADGSEQVGTVIPWTDLLKALGGGSILTSILAFLGKIKPFVGPAIDVINNKLPSPPPTVDTQKDEHPHFADDTIELVQAALAYAAKKDDKTCQRRFSIAAITELSDMVELQSPEVAKALNALLIATTNVWLPIPPAATVVKS